MSKLTDTILKEKMKVRPNRNYIQMLQQIAEKDTFTYDDFIRTARIVPRNTFQAEAENAKLLDECTDVYCYVGGLFIQGVRGGKFYSEVYQNESDEQPCIRIETTNVELLEKILFGYFC